MLPEGVEELCCLVSDPLQSGLNRLSEGGLGVLGVFDVLIQTVLQGGAQGLHAAETNKEEGVSESS